MKVARVLVSATDRSMRTAARDALQGFAVVETSDDLTMTAVAAACRPDVLVLDVTDPVRSAATVAALRGDFRTAQTSTVFIAGEAPLSGAVADAFGAADDFVRCPFDPEELASRVHICLRRSSERRGLNPLTGLPGNTLVEQEIRARSARGEDFACLYVDLDQFKSYNDRYGFARGDGVILSVARCLIGILEAHSTGSCFAGHVGGDDFVVLAPSAVAERVAKAIVGATAVNGPECSVSVGVVMRAGTLGGPDEIAEAAAAAKSEAKGERGSSCAFYPSPAGRP